MPSIESLTPTEVTSIDQYPDLYRIWNLPSTALDYDPADVRINPIPDSRANPYASGVGGSQRGDEGKGDETAKEVQTAIDQGMEVVAVKGAGGGGTGHNFYPKDSPEDGIVFSVLPAAVEKKSKQVVGRAVLVRLDKLNRELELMNSLGYDTSPNRIQVDEAAFISWSGYSEIDAAQENQRGANAIGTTKSGVGPMTRAKMKCGGSTSSTVQKIKAYS